MKTQKLILGVAGLFLVAYFSWLVFGSGDWFITHSRNASNRASLLKIRDYIHVGDGYESALKSFWQLASKDLRLSAESPQIWAVSMPSEIGATNWVLYVEFRDGKVSAVKVRTSDGPHPTDAPENVGG